MTVVLDLRGTTLKLPPESLGDAYWSSTAADALVVAKQKHRFAVAFPLTDGTDVTALTKLIHVAGGAGKVTGIEVTPGETAPNGGDKKWTVDVLKSTAGGAFASIIDTTKDVGQSSVALTPETPLTVSASTYKVSDVFQVVVTVSGSSGNQGQGGVVVVWFNEEPV